MQTQRDVACHHCGIPLVVNDERRRIWCMICAKMPLGQCTRCKGDVTESRGCWATLQELEHALVKANFSETSCTDCKHSLVLTQHGMDRGVRMARYDCPACRGTLRITWTKGRKPPPTLPGAA